jgi:hypothetical protein
MRSLAICWSGHFNKLRIVSKIERGTVQVEVVK